MPCITHEPIPNDCVHVTQYNSIVNKLCSTLTFIEKEYGTEAIEKLPVEIKNWWLNHKYFDMNRK
jgi:hypothetical protein